MLEERPNDVFFILVMQAGIIEEMIEESFESLEEDDLEEAAQEEVDKILWEVTSGRIANIFYVNKYIPLYCFSKHTVSKSVTVI